VLTQRNSARKLTTVYQDNRREYVAHLGLELYQSAGGAAAAARGTESEEESEEEDVFQAAAPPTLAAPHVQQQQQLALVPVPIPGGITGCWSTGSACSHVPLAVLGAGAPPARRCVRCTKLQHPPACLTCTCR